MTLPRDAAVEPQPTGNGRSLFANSSVMAAGSLTSRLLGVVRVGALAALFSTNTRQADLLVAATVIPNLIYFLIAGGALNSILVPLIVKAMNRDRDGGEAFTNRIITLFGLVVLGTTALSMLLSPVWLPLYLHTWFTPELAGQAANIQLLTLLTLPQIFFMGAYMIFSQVLNAKESFGPMMWTPVLNNVVYLAALAYYGYRWPHTEDLSAPFSTEQCLVLGIGGTLGIVAQFVFLIPFLWRNKVRYRPRFDFKGTGLAATFHVAKWVVISALITQLVAMFLNQLVLSATTKSGTGAGGYVYSQSYILFQIPIGLITVSLVTAMLPAISHHVANHRFRSVGIETMHLIKLTSTFIVPVSIAMVVLSPPIVEAFIGYGAANNEKALVPMVLTLSIYCLSLPWFSVNYVLVRTYLAMERTKALFIIGAIQDGLNVVMAISFVGLFGSPNTIAPLVVLAASLVLIPVVIITYGGLSSRVPGVSFGATMVLWIRLAVATLPAAFVCVSVYAVVNRAIPTRMGAYITLVVCGVIGPPLFALFARWLRITEVTELTNVLMRKIRRPAA